MRVRLFTFLCVSVNPTDVSEGKKPPSSSDSLNTTRDCRCPKRLSVNFQLFGIEFRWREGGKDELNFFVNSRLSRQVLCVVVVLLVERQAAAIIILFGFPQTTPQHLVRLRPPSVALLDPGPPSTTSGSTVRQETAC